jgi:Transposase DDE domain
MTTIPQLAHAMSDLLSTAADSAARQIGFVKRRSKLSGAAFVQTLVFGWQSKPDATLSNLAQSAATVGVKLTPQALDQRFTEQGATLLHKVLEAVVGTLISKAQPVAVPLLERFNGVYLLDSTTIRLPDALQHVWMGCGGDAGAAALKMQVRLELSTGAMAGPLVQAGRTHDRTTPLPMQGTQLGAGALRLADLGYFKLNTFSTLHKQGIYWLSRLQSGTILYDLDGTRMDLPQLARWLSQKAAKQGETLDVRVLMGAKHKLECRLLAERVPARVAEERRRRLHDGARRRQQGVSKSGLILADWTLFVTNVPEGKLSLQEALVLARARWQIELLFKIWKQYGLVDEWRSQKPWRIMCEVYAKLIGLVLQHWLVVVGCWHNAARSMAKAAQLIQRHAMHIASVLNGPRRRLIHALDVVSQCLDVGAGCSLNQRKKSPNTYQLLLSFPTQLLA